MANELAGKVAIITGAASGIGRGTAELFVAEGAKVVIADLDAPKGGEVAAQLGEAAAFKRTNVADADEVQALIDFAVGHFGGLHVIYNNAGITGVNQPTIEDDDFHDFQKVLSINLMGAILGTQRAARYMAKHGGGSIINTGSIGGVLPGYGITAYRMSKAGVNYFTKCAAIEYAPFGIRVNCINPGSTLTAMQTQPEPGMAPEVVAELGKAMSTILMAGQALKRQGMPIDIANAALYLASDRSAQVTGHALTVDGGHSVGDNNNYTDQMVEARARILADAKR